MISRRLLQLSLAPIVLASIAVSPHFAAAQSEQQSAPSAPEAQQAPSAPPAPAEAKLPPVDERNFTAAQPTRAEVEGFLKTSWGYDPNRTWEVFGIQKTPAPGLSRVMVLVTEKGQPQVAQLTFFVTPDGHYLIANDAVIPFGADPFRAAYETLQQQADGPWQGSANKKLELVEFADFQCPHCKSAEPTIKKLIADFPQAHYVYENFPLVNIHDEAFTAAAYGACVAKSGGNSAFFKYSDDVFAHQEGLTPEAVKQTLANAVTAAGLDPAKISACADSAAGKDAVNASIALGKQLNVDQTPTLYIDGRPIPVNELPYEQLKKIVEYQFSLDQGK